MDVITQRYVALGLALISCLCLVGMVVLAASGHESPQVMGALTHTAASTSGILVGIFVTPRPPSAGTGQSPPG